MRIISSGAPLDLDTVGLDQAYLDAVCLSFPHYFEALLIAIEFRGVSRGYAQAYAHNPGLHKLHKG